MILWARNIERAKKIQDALKKRLTLFLPVRRVSSVCGLDASYSETTIYACASLFKFPDLTHLEDGFSKLEIQFPYVPGFLSFREGRALISALKKLSVKPDVLLIDGHGLAHPRSVGLATHVGIASGIPSIGCAKSVLSGEFNIPGEKRGSYTYLFLEGKKAGAVLRTRDRTKPVFVSPGYMMDIFSAIDLVLKCSRGYRIPEPLRRAHSYSKRAKELAQKK